MRIYTVGGYSEVGKNMTVVETKDDAVILDAGLYLPPIVELEERDKVFTEKRLRDLKAIPDDTILDSIGVNKKVRAILLGHAHLDHVGAVPYMAHRYNTEVVGSHFTIEVLNSLIKDSGSNFNNPLKRIQPNSHYDIKGKGKIKAEFINITHSTPQTSLMALHTEEGTLLYANDFKIDNSPQLGRKPNYEAIRKIAKEGVKALVVESIYAMEERKTPSEKVAKDLLEDVMLSVDNKGSGIIVSTFSSHIARLKSIVEFGKKLRRKVVFLGRSLHKYSMAAIESGVTDFGRNVTIVRYARKVNSILKKINKERDKFLIVCTGHQGEPGSILDRISRNETPFRLAHKDHVIFSSSTIPTEVNRKNKMELEEKLKRKGVRIFNNVHVSGHAGREDLRDFINMVNPEHIIPAHADLPKLSALAELATELGYKVKKDCHVMQNLKTLKI